MQTNVIELFIVCILLLRACLLFFLKSNSKSLKLWTLHLGENLNQQVTTKNDCFGGCQFVCMAQWNVLVLFLSWIVKVKKTFIDIYSAIQFEFSPSGRRLVNGTKPSPNMETSDSLAPFQYDTATIRPLEAVWFSTYRPISQSLVSNNQPQDGTIVIHQPASGFTSLSPPLLKSKPFPIGKGLDIKWAVMNNQSIISFGCCVEFIE